jgi:hypothetical protein
MESEDKKKPYTQAALTKLDRKQAIKLVMERKKWSEEEATKFIDSLSASGRQNKPGEADGGDLKRGPKAEAVSVTGIAEGGEKRRHRRIELEIEVIVRTDSALLPGRTQDISESGMSGILPVELREGQEVELQIKLPSSTQTVRAIVRHRNVFRHGFEFLQPLHGIFETLPGV